MVRSETKTTVERQLGGDDFSGPGAVGTVLDHSAYEVQTGANAGAVDQRKPGSARPRCLMRLTSCPSCRPSGGCCCGGGRPHPPNPVGRSFERPAVKRDPPCGGGDEARAGARTGPYTHCRQNGHGGTLMNHLSGESLIAGRMPSLLLPNPLGNAPAAPHGAENPDGITPIAFPEQGTDGDADR